MTFTEKDDYVFLGFICFVGGILEEVLDVLLADI